MCDPPAKDVHTQPWESTRTCAQKFALFWLVYNREMKKHVDDWYRVEETTPCEVAALGGFTNSKEVLYEPHLETVSPDHCTLLKGFLFNDPNMIIFHEILDLCVGVAINQTCTVK